MEKVTCKVCGKVFAYPKLASCRAQLAAHLKSHNMTKEEYVLKYYYNGVAPLCACGCGTPTHLKINAWEFNRYAADSHVGKAHSEEGKKIKEALMQAKKVVWDEEKYYTNRYDESFVRSSANDFLSKLYSLSELADKYKTDKRTLQKAWFAYKVVTPEQYQEITSYFKYKVSAEKRLEKYEVPADKYAWAYLLIKEHPKKYTTNSLIKEYNKNRINKEDINPFVFYNQLKRKYGDEVDLYLAKGIHSSIEYKFYEVLSFYFPDEYIELGFRLDSFIYDFCIGSKLIIEYDDDGFYHSSKAQKKKDKNKEKIALDAGYRFLRVSSTEIKTIELLERIKKCLD